jgi:F-type H+-transporting ATPase subunit a
VAVEHAAGGAAAHGGGPIQPLHQFEVHPIGPEIKIGSLNLWFNNAALWMLIAAAIACALMLLGMRRRAVVPGRAQSVAESLYEFVAGMVRDNAGNEGLRYFPFIFTIFIFILLSNLLGLIPGSFTVTSHIIVTLALAVTVFTTVTVIGFVKHGPAYLKLFVPDGVPGWLLPLLAPIEVTSYFIRPFSLGIRLFANMMAGHMMLVVFGGFVVMLGAWAGWLPLIIMVALYALELLIAFLQAFVFALLSSIYLNDALHMHH